MLKPEDIKIPPSFNYEEWIELWDKMQSRHLFRRNERFELISSLISATQSSVDTILDIGCGTGSLMFHMLQTFPNAKVIGIDFDPTLIILAKARLKEFSNRSEIIFADLRQKSWLTYIHNSFNAIISATAIHWFNAKQLEILYSQFATVLNYNGIFLNADHVANEYKPIQLHWEKHRDEMLKQELDPNSYDWKSFWDKYSETLSMDINEIHKRVIDGYETGDEDGLPLKWHMNKLESLGFSALDCFWRNDCDAIYGGIFSKIA